MEDVIAQLSLAQRAYEKDPAAFQMVGGHSRYQSSGVAAGQRLSIPNGHSFAERNAVYHQILERNIISNTQNGDLRRSMAEERKRNEADYNTKRLDES